MIYYEGTVSKQTEGLPDFSRATQCPNPRALSAHTPNVLKSWMQLAMVTEGPQKCSRVL